MWLETRASGIRKGARPTKWRLLFGVKLPEANAFTQDPEDMNSSKIAVIALTPWAVGLKRDVRNLVHMR